uniref:Uncharacterized protein n=1 Tax=Cannabis sativa TaxID=3483 RepID=A0A803P763_CANSA
MFFIVFAISRVVFIRETIGVSFESKIPSPNGALDPRFEAFVERGPGYGVPYYPMPQFSQPTRGGFNRDGRTNASSKKPQCQLCHKIGHTAVDCFYRFHKSFTGVQSHSSTPSPQAHLAQTSAQNDTNWYPDSGATNHCTPHIHNLASSSTYEGSEQLFVGDGTGSGASPNLDDWDIPEWPVFI